MNAAAAAQPITIRYASHTVRKTTHGEKTFKSAAALDVWLARQDALCRDIEILAYAAD